ncbi:polysaccharide pyruvyl transferase family protein [Algibacter pectinivorans]|uniref:Polysaccharide pyruvyl transferase family protein WcaK n=1 Tax=Algibacter pectinivorans TaxID=870482 RepID=A0A1I1NXW1_9FLAO|nr:polysaccharide pyruvyl transferase family protein [Algibacter pectinivorans]SFD02531.1 Polysaccharide pyruvyl transferase family protein WcaK [Algibacter pectinivorans]
MKKVGHFGTFDVDNYGDLLFPHIAEFRLPKYQWDHISPTNNQTVFKDSRPIISFDKAKNNAYDAILIGGGNILHLLPNYVTVYNNKKGFAYANLWVGAAKIAIEQKIPLLFNAPGISRGFKGFIQKKIAIKTFKSSNYLAFREGISKQIVSNSIKRDLNFKNKICVVPDTAFDIHKLWPLDTSTGSNYITINLNSRYHCPINETAKELDALSKKLKMPIKLIIIGDCHGDKFFTEQVSKLMKCDYSIVESDELKTVAHVIGKGKYFLGSSMHGFITALAYGVPSFLVLNNKSKVLHKFKGLLELAELSNNVILNSFNNVGNKLNESAYLTKQVKQKIDNTLNEHWQVLNNIIQSKEKPKFSFYIVKFDTLLNLSNRFNRILNKFF